MNNQETQSTAKIGAFSALMGSLCMFTGAGMWAASGADLDKALNIKELDCGK